MPNLYDLFPDDFNLDLYRDNYEDLQGLNLKELLRHWNSYGIAEGRIASTVSSRQHILEIISTAKSILEIGPFDTPFIHSLKTQISDISYADICTTDELRERAKNLPNRNPKNVPHIDFILKDGLSTISRQFHCVVSIQVVEHQPDLIQHFLDVQKILYEGGIYL